MSTRQLPKTSDMAGIGWEDQGWDGGHHRGWDCEKAGQLSACVTSPAVTHTVACHCEA